MAGQKGPAYDCAFQRTIQTAGFEKPDIAYGGRQKLIAYAIADEPGFTDRFIPSEYLSSAPEDVGAIILYDEEVLDWIRLTWSQHLSEKELSETPSDASDFFFDLKGSGVTIDEYIGKDKRVIIPDTIEGAPVTAIGRDAFRFKDTTSIEIPQSVAFIEKGVFEESPSLTVWCEEGSYAQAYCDENSIHYVLTNK